MIRAPVNIALTHVTPTLLPILLFPLHDLLFTSLFITFSLHDTLSTSIPTPRPTLYFSIHYIPTPRHTLYFYSHSTSNSLLLYSIHYTHSLLLTSVDTLLSSLHLYDSLHLPIMY